MKIIRQGIALFLIAGLAQAAEEFEVKAYSPSSGAVEISCGGEITNRPFNSFSADDQQKITGWLADKEFQSSFGLSITTEQQKKRVTENSKKVSPKTAKKGEGGNKVETTVGEFQGVSYLIKFENLSQVEFQNLGMEYRIFYETQEGSEKTKKYERGMTVCEKLLPGEIWTFETPVITIRAAQKEVTNIDWKGTNIMEATKVTRSTSVKDRFKGMHLCVSKKGRSGENIERECIVGSVPEKENWADYQQQEKPNSAEQAPKTEMRKPVVGKDWSEEQLQHYIQNGNYGNYMSALVVAEYYYRQGDQKKTKQWADKVRTLVKSRPKAQQEEAAKRLAVLDQMGKESDER